MSRDFIEQVRRLTTTGSDYAVAKLLGISQDAVNRYRKGQRIMDNSTAVKVSELLGVPVEQVIADAELQRGHDPGVTMLWKKRAAEYMRKRARRR